MAGATNDGQFQAQYFPQSQQNFFDGTNMHGRQDEEHSQIPHTQASASFTNAYDMPNGLPMDAYSMEGLDATFFNQTNLNLANFDEIGALDPQFLDLIENNGSFDLQGLDQDGAIADDMEEEELPDRKSSDDVSELHDKRKSPEDEKEDNENGSKRRDGEEKVAKKPGRKPLTSEPTTKRKAQNRAAQRAFRERKEKHLKDLENKVVELEKKSEAANHENAALKSQVDRLQIEVREYRKRLSMSSAGMLGHSPPLGGFKSALLSGANGASQPDLQFDLPRFGTLPKGPFFDASKFNATQGASPEKATLGSGSSGSRSGSISRSPKSQSLSNTSLSGSNSVTANQTPKEKPCENFGSAFGKLTAEPTNFSVPGATAPTANQSSTDQPGLNQSRLFQFNNPLNAAGSPSISSSSQYGGPTTSSSCGTSPEPSHNSPPTGNKDSTLEPITEQQGFTCHKTEDGEISFCEKLNMACGNTRNPVPRAMSTASNGTPAPSTATSGSFFGSSSQSSTATAMPLSTPATNPTPEINFFASPNNQLDPLLFGEFDPQSFIGDGGFTGGFFNDAMPTFDFGSPAPFAMDLSQTGLTPNVQKSNPMEQADPLQEGIDIDLDGGDDEVVPGEDTSKMLSCHKIWEKFQSHEVLQAGIKDGSIDIDSLCLELRAKACCSETGVVVDQMIVDETLKRLGQGIRSNSEGETP